MKIKVGDKAPSFKAKDQKGKTYKLSDYSGKWLLLYFYPKDFTSGCTTEACEFRDNFTKLKRMVKIVGVSADSVNSHAKFSTRHQLPFALLSDPKKKIISRYGAKAKISIRRFTYIIDPKRKIAKIYKSVNPKDHAQQILKDLQTLQSTK